MATQMESPVGGFTRIGGRYRHYFSGCSYLGLQNHPRVIAAAENALRTVGLSTATSRGGYGEHPIYTALEQEAKIFFGCEDVLYFSSGYMGISILMTGLTGHYERSFIDSAAHYSLWDALHLSQKPYHTFEHINPEDLLIQVKQNLQPGERPMIISDGVFPISGEIAPVPEYLKIAQQYDGKIFLDDAHASGVLGENGRGTCEYYQIADKHIGFTTTLSKGLGGYGGIIPWKSSIHAEIRAHCHQLIGSSPVPLPIAAASRQSLSIAREDKTLREKLQENIRLARNGFSDLGWNIPLTPSAIICLKARNGIDLAKLQADLYENDICVAHVTSYTSTPSGGALRIAIFATHTIEQIHLLLNKTEMLLHQSY